MNMTASLHPIVTKPDDNSDDESTITVDLSLPKTSPTPIPKVTTQQSFQHPLPFPMAPFNLFPRMPMFVPPLSSAVFAIYSKALQAQKLTASHRPRFLPSTNAASTSLKIKSSNGPKTTAPNPIVNAVLQPGSETNSVINQNVCAVCGEAFRLTGDLVHHMRRERCRQPTSSELSAPYRIPKHHAK